MGRSRACQCARRRSRRYRPGCSGEATYVKVHPRLPLCPSGFLTVTTTEPGRCGPVTAVSFDEVTTTTSVASTFPNVRVAPVRKSLPVTVIAVPPRDEPEAGSTAPTRGAGAFEPDGWPRPTHPGSAAPG